MTTGDEQARLARKLLAGTLNGMLSTHSLEHPGYPLGTLVPYVIGQDGLPLMLLSHLSQHTRNVAADARCGLLVVQRGEGDVQQLARLSALGNLLPDSASDDAERYFRYFPQTREYHEKLNFRFYRFQALRFHWNGGFASARWFSNDRIVRVNPLGESVQQQIIAHANKQQADAMRRYLLDADGSAPQQPASLLGIDAEGFDLRAGGRIQRVDAPRMIGSADDARQVLIEMARQ